MELVCYFTNLCNYKDFDEAVIVFILPYLTSCIYKHIAYLVFLPAACPHGFVVGPSVSEVLYRRKI